jgi:formylglycine-generating enzyme required for sulfatase activity
MQIETTETSTTSTHSTAPEPNVTISSVRSPDTGLQTSEKWRRVMLAIIVFVVGAILAIALNSRVMAADANSEATTPADMQPYAEEISGTVVKFDMVPIPGGRFLMGSPEDEEGRNEDEGPQHEVEIAPFWMGRCEVTWDEYEIWMFNLDIQRRQLQKLEPTELDKLADAVTRPTKPYTDMSFGMGKERFPAICMTQLAAKTYCQWLTAKTGHYYRLPTEAEWEYACRAGTTTPYYFGEDAAALDEHAWYFDNSDDNYHEVGEKKPNPWGLYDMHGNVAEWCLDQYDPEIYARHAKEGLVVAPYVMPTKPYPHVARGGSWDDDPEMLRSAARRASDKSWKVQDPQLPQSIWYFTDAQFAGFRVVRPLVEPSEKQKQEYMAAGSEIE